MNRSRSLNLLQFDPEIEETFRRRLREQNELRRQQQQMERQEGQLEPIIRHEPAPRDGILPGFDHQAGRVQNPGINEEDMLFRDYLNRPVVENQGGIIYPSYGHPNFQLRPDVINLFSSNISFYGRLDENPYNHIARFMEMVSNFTYEGVNMEAIRMRLFVHTLKDKAREWLDALPPGSITSWVELIQKFTTKFFPPARVVKLKHDITTFRQHDTEVFHEAWE